MHVFSCQVEQVTLLRQSLERLSSVGIAPLFPLLDIQVCLDVIDNGLISGSVPQVRSRIPRDMTAFEDAFLLVDEICDDQELSTNPPTVYRNATFALLHRR